MKKAISLLIILLFITTGYSQAQFIFKSYDLNPGTGYSSPSTFINFNGKFYFTAYRPSTGYELWSGDTSAGGISMLKDIWPGTGYSSPQSYCVSGGKLFFIADDGVNGRQLWTSDGTAAGTKVINAGLYLNAPNYPLFAYNGKILFGGKTVAKGTELWISDGTDTGTKMIMDIYTGTSSSSPDNFTLLNGKVYFSATDAANGNELWQTDGTATGTTLVKDINPGTPHSTPMRFCVNGSKFYFSAFTYGEGIELWESDGTAAGTKLLKDIAPGVANSLPSVILPYNGKLYFAAADTNGSELWASDGTTAGTMMIKDINPGGFGSGPVFFINYNNKIYFQATDTSGAELWVTDGTASGTKQVKDIQPGAGSSSLLRPFVYKKLLYFIACPTGTDKQLMQTDGTAAGTKVIAPSTNVKTAPLANTWEFFMYSADSAMYFTADYDSIGLELWSLTDTTTYPPPSCDSPTAIHFANVTLSNATISWDSVSGATGYEYYIAPSPSTPPLSGTVILNDTCLVSGLAPDTKYDFCVRTRCSAQVSGWICDTFTTAGTAIYEPAGRKLLKVYPNPNTGIFTIDIPTGFRSGMLTITNIYGQVVERKEITGTANWNFNLKTATKGIYTIEVKHEGDIYREKIVLQ